MENALNWFEIPVLDMARATRFYSTVMGFESEMEAGPSGEGYLMAMFPTTTGVGGALMQGEGYIPSMEGSLIYLNCGTDLGPMLARVEAAGGRVLRPKTVIGQHGAVAIIADTEGNQVALHSMG